MGRGGRKVGEVCGEKGGRGVGQGGKEKGGGRGEGGKTLGTAARPGESTVLWYAKRLGQLAAAQPARGQPRNVQANRARLGFLKRKQFLIQGGVVCFFGGNHGGTGEKFGCGP